MTSEVGYVDNTSMLAHYAMLEKIRDLALANSWTVLRYDTTPANRELILKGPGFSGTEEIFVGFRTYHNVASDYYNLVAAGFTGYVASSSFDTQPNAMLSAVPAHNQRIDYWLTVNPQRIALGMKVGTPVYELAYVGKAFPFGKPSQYPYPLVCAGMLSGVPATRFSDVTHSMPYKGSRANMRLLFNSGTWLQPATYPWNQSYLTNTTVTSANQIRPTGTNYPTIPIVMMDASNLYGVLDGVEMITGFDNVVENTFTRGGKAWVVLQDVGRTGFNDYIAMRLD